MTSIHPESVAGATPAPRRLAVRVAVVLAIFAAVLSVADTAGAESESQAEIARHDQLIAEQEALINDYRCRFNIDAHLTPGG